MSDIEKVLKDVVYGSVGAFAAAIEAGSDLARTFVEKGQEAVRQGQAKVEEQRQAIHDACIRETGIDLTKLTREQRDALRRDLENMLMADRASADKTAAESDPIDTEADEDAETEDAPETEKADDDTENAAEEPDYEEGNG